MCVCVCNLARHWPSSFQCQELKPLQPFFVGIPVLLCDIGGGSCLLVFVQEIRRSFKRLALKLHPDKNPNNPDAHDTFVRLNAAFEVLKDQKLRKIYDQHGEEGVKEAQGGGDPSQDHEFRSWQYYKVHMFCVACMCVFCVCVCVLCVYVCVCVRVRVCAPPPPFCEEHTQ